MRKDNLTEWTPGTITEAIEELVETVQSGNDPKLAAKVGGLKAYYRSYEITKNPILLEDIIMELIDIIKEGSAFARESADTVALKADQPFSANTAGQNNSFLYIDPKTGELRGSCFPDFNKRGLLETESPYVAPESILISDLIKAFEDRLCREARQKGKENTSTVKIYSNCIYKELVYNDPDGLLSGEINTESVREAIDKALIRLKKEEAQENKNNENKEYKRYKKNETAALNKLKKLLEGLMRDIKNR